MSGFWSLQVTIWPKRKKRQKKDQPAEAAIAASDEQAEEPEKAIEPPTAPPQEQIRPQVAPAAAQSAAPEQQATVPNPAQQAPPATRQLWGREFTLVNGGLSPDQVVSFFESVRADYEKRLRERGDSTTWDSFSKQVLAEAEREAARIKLKAKQEAEVEASRLISEGKRHAQDETERASRRAQEITEKGVQDILSAANKKAQITESRARQLSQLMLIRAREDIQDHITGEVQRAYHKLNGMLEDMMGSAKGIEAEWRDKTLELWSVPALEESTGEPLLLEEGQMEVLGATSTPTVQEVPQAQATEPTHDQVDSAQEVNVESTPTSEPEVLAPEPVAGPVSELQEEPRVPPAPAIQETAPASPVIGDEAPEKRPEAQTAPADKIAGPPVAPIIEQGAPASIMIGEETPPPRPEAQMAPSDKIAGPPVAPVIPVAPIIEEGAPATPVVDQPSIDREVPPAPHPSPVIQIPEEPAAEAQEKPGQYVPSVTGGSDTVLGEETTPAAPEADQPARQSGESSSPGLGGMLAPRVDNQPAEDAGKFDDLYNGEVDLVLSPPVDFGKVSELYSHLQTLPGVRVLHTAGSWEQGTVVTVIMDKAGPLIGPLKTLPTLDAKPLSAPNAPGLLRSAMGSLGEKGRRRQRIGIVFKGGQAPQPDTDGATPQDQQTSA